MNKLSLLSVSHHRKQYQQQRDTNNSACFGRDEVEIVVFLLRFLNFDTLEMLISRGQVKNLFSEKKRDKTRKNPNHHHKNTLNKTHIFKLNMAASMQSISFARSTAGSTSSLRRKNVAPRRIVNTQAQAKVRLKIGD